MMIAPARSRTGLTLRQVIQLTAVMCVLAVILYPLFTGGDRYGPRLCLSHLQRLGTAMTMYSQDYDGSYPSCQPAATPDWGSVGGGSGDSAGRPWRSSSFWIAQLLPYAKDAAVFRCSQDVDPERNQK